MIGEMESEDEEKMAKESQPGGKEPKSEQHQGEPEGEVRGTERVHEGWVKRKRG